MFFKDLGSSWWIKLEVEFHQIQSAKWKMTLTCLTLKMGGLTLKMTTLTINSFNTPVAFAFSVWRKHPVRWSKGEVRESTESTVGAAFPKSLVFHDNGIGMELKLTETSDGNFFENGVRRILFGILWV